MPPHAMFPEVEHISLTQLTSLPYKEQAIWFMNGFWSSDRGGIGEYAEEIWLFTKHFVKLDNEQTPPKGENGNELDQFFAAKFLEDFEQTLTAVERKAAFREIDADSNGRMALIEYLIYRYKKGVDEAVKAPQGAAAEILAANKVIETVLALLPELEAKISEQRELQTAQLVALQETRIAKASAEDSYQKQLEAEAELQQAVRMFDASKAELEEAVKELREQEEAHARHMSELEAQSKDMSLGQVARGKAANMLIGLQNEDPLPLRKAKITQEAALRRVEREQKRAAEAAEEAKVKAAECKSKKEELEAKEADLEAKKAALATAIAELEASYNELQSKMTEAQAALVKLKESTAGLGAVWWMERQLFDADYYLPQNRRKYDHSKPFQFKPPEPGTEAAEPIAKFTPMEKPKIGAKPVIDFKFGRVPSKSKMSDSVSEEKSTVEPTVSVDSSTPATDDSENASSVSKPALEVASAEDSEVERLISSIAGDVDTLCQRASALTNDQSARIEEIARKLQDCKH